MVKCGKKCSVTGRWLEEREKKEEGWPKGRALIKGRKKMEIEVV